MQRVQKLERVLRVQEQIVPEQVAQTEQTQIQLAEAKQDMK